jgi:ABC-type Fe3+ transport system permease subunit
VIKLEQFDYNGAAALGFMMLLVSFLMLLAINLVQGWSRRRQSGVDQSGVRVERRARPRARKAVI